MMNVKRVDLVIVIYVYACMFVYRHRLNNDYLVLYQEKSCHQSKIFVTANKTGCTIQFPVKTKENAAVAFDTLVSKKLTLLILVVATCIELALLLSIVIYWRLSREELPEDKKQQQQLCYRSDRFPTHSDNISICPRGLEMNMKNDTKTCCGNSDLILVNLVTKALSEKYNSDVNPELPSLDLELDQCNVTRIKPPMVKLIGLAGDKSPVEEGNSSKIFWNSNIQTYATSGLTYISNDGTIYVGKAGYYFIHSQLKVKVISTNDTEDDVRDIFTHNVRLIPIKKDTSFIILEDRKSQCEMASKESEITSAVGGVFWLEQKDRLYVATSQPKLLLQRDNCIVFSMHRL